MSLPASPYRELRQLPTPSSGSTFSHPEQAVPRQQHSCERLEALDPASANPR
jgi:hypothetical protein